MTDLHLPGRPREDHIYVFSTRPGYVWPIYERSFPKEQYAEEWKKQARERYGHVYIHFVNRLPYRYYY
jgi:hypothetical protein